MILLFISNHQSQILYIKKKINKKNIIKKIKKSFWNGFNLNFIGNGLHIKSATENIKNKKQLRQLKKYY